MLVAGSLAGCGVSSIHDVGATGGLGAAGGPNTADASNVTPKVAKDDVTAKTIATGPKEAPRQGADVSAARQAADKLTSSATPGNAAYRIGPLDVLDVSVFKVKDLSTSVQVSDAGTINLPLVGEIQAAGRTARDVEQDLTKRFGDKYLQNPQVTVFIKEYNSQRITVEGAVKKPGVYPIQGRLTLLQAIATANGVEPSSDQTVMIFRDVSGKRQGARFDLSEIRGGETMDPALQAGDVVVVNSSAIKEAFGHVTKLFPLASVFLAL